MKSQYSIRCLGVAAAVALVGTCPVPAFAEEAVSNAVVAADLLAEPLDAPLADPFAGLTVRDQVHGRGLMQARSANVPKVGQTAPDFSLTTADGKQTIRLSDYRGKRPVVLIFGSLTWGPFVQASGDVNRIQERFKDHVDFLLVYLREAHPKDGWAKQGFSETITDPRTLGERNSVATQCGQVLKFNFPVVVDTMDDATAVDYAAWPERIFVVDEQGKVAYAGHQGPWGFWPSERSIRKRINPRTGEQATGDTLEEFLERRFLAQPEPMEAP